MMPRSTLATLKNFNFCSTPIPAARARAIFSTRTVGVASVPDAYTWKCVSSILVCE